MDIRTMDADVIVENIEQDFEALATEHETAANNELLWSLGSADEEDSKMHLANSRMHRMLAKLYLNMKNDALAFLETYENNEED